MQIGQTKNNVANLLQLYTFTKKKKCNKRNSENWTNQNYCSEATVAFPNFTLFIYIFWPIKNWHMHHNIFTISLCIHCTYNVNLYYRHIKLANFVHICKICIIFTLFFLQMCIIFYTFFYVYNIRLQSKHIKILKKQKQKQSSN